MAYLRQIGTYLGIKITQIRDAIEKQGHPNTAHLSFCPRCPMTETKVDRIFLGSDGKAYCTPDCAGRHGVMITEVYNSKDQKWERRDFR